MAKYESRYNAGQLEILEDWRRRGLDHVEVYHREMELLIDGFENTEYCWSRNVPRIVVANLSKEETLARIAQMHAAIDKWKRDFDEQSSEVTEESTVVTSVCSALSGLFKRKQPNLQDQEFQQVQQITMEYLNTFGVRAPNQNETREAVQLAQDWVNAGRPNTFYVPSYHVSTTQQAPHQNNTPATSSGQSVYWQSNQQALYAFFANYLAALYAVRNNGSCNNEEYVNWITHVVLEPRKYRDDYVNFSDREFNTLDSTVQRVLTSRITETLRSYQGPNGYRQYAVECVRVLGLRLEINVTRMNIANRILAGANGNDIRNALYEFLNMSDPDSPLLNEI